MRGKPTDKRRCEGTQNPGKKSAGILAGPYRETTEIGAVVAGRFVPMSGRQPCYCNVALFCKNSGLAIYREEP